MGNGLRNAGFLDGVDAWTQSSGAMSVDEATLGAPGRAVLRLDATGSVGGTFYLRSNTPFVAVAPGQAVEASALWTAPGTAGLVVRWLDSGGATISTASVPQVAAGMGAASLGARETFNRSLAGGLVAPASTASALLMLTTTLTASGALVLGLLRPYLALAGAVTPAPWDPGSHANADLAAIAAWPTGLPRFQAGSQATPYANREDFTGSSNIPTASLLYRRPQNEFRGQMRLSRLQLAQLEAFQEQGAKVFYFLRPDTDTLCLASWVKDGAPKVVGVKGAWLLVEVGLKLRVL